MTQRGILRITSPAPEDAKIIAELYGIQYLLEVKEVVGNNVAGHENTHLFVSLGAIKKLARMGSDKQHIAEYAKFLITRFKGCPIEVIKNEKWLSTEEMPIIELDASEPLDEKIEVTGIGEVVLTAHVVEKYSERFGIEVIGDARRKLRRIAGEPKVREIEKNNPKTKIKFALKGKEEGRYFYHPTQDVIMVLANNAKGNLAMVTVYPATTYE